MEHQVSVEELSVGMFVSDLDRPWLDTPFLVQGFLIEDEATLMQLRRLCRHVMVDLSRSNLGDNNALAVRARDTTLADAAAPVLRMVPSPPMPQHRAKTQSWLSRWLQGLNQVREPLWHPTPDPASSSHPAKITRGAQAHGSAVDSRPTQPPHPDPKRAKGVALARATQPKQESLESSGKLLAWLRDNFDRIRSSGTDAASEPGNARESSSSVSRPKRKALEIRVYQDIVPIEQELNRANESFARATETLGAVIQDIRFGKGLQLEAVESVVEDLVESIIRHPGALQLVSRLREADESAYTHALQVAVLMVSFGRELGFSRQELAHLGQVGMLLDVGKMRVERSILTKRENLTAEEFEEVKRHVQYGLEIIAPSALAHPDVIAGIAQHHERLNGTGYPKALKEEEIAAFGQMGGIVDAFSALTSVRPYAEPSSPYEAMRQLQGWGGTYFNAGLVEQFIQAIGIFPVGTLVELSTGEIAVVLEQNRARRLKPKVLVISAPDKTPLKIPATLDLLYGSGATSSQLPYIRRGLATDASAVDPREYYLSRS